MLIAVPFTIANTWGPPSAYLLVNRKDIEQPNNGKLLGHLKFQLQIRCSVGFQQLLNRVYTCIAVTCVYILLPSVIPLISLHHSDNHVASCVSFNAG